MKTLAAFLLLLVSLRAFGQSATLAVPEVPPARTGFIVGVVHEKRNEPTDPPANAWVSVDVWKLDANGEKAGVTVVTMTTSVELVGFLAAIETPVAGEATGTTLAARSRRHNARVLNYLVTSCATFAQPCPASLSTATFVP